VGGPDNLDVYYSMFISVVNNCVIFFIVYRQN